jgi:cytochrome c oxidase subunit 2
MGRDRGSRRSVVALLAVALALGACTAPPATVEADRVQGLYNLFLIAAGAVFVVVAGLIGWNIVRYRSRGGDSLPVQTNTNLVLELIWWALPTLLVIGLFVASAAVLNTNDAKHSGAPLRVKVEGFQWQWRFTYLESKVQLTGVPGSPPELVLPVGESVRFELSSPDVIHSFWVPAFTYKMDVVPGRNNYFNLTPEREGTFVGKCTELCGTYHSRMLFNVKVVSAEDFKAELEKLRSEGNTGLALGGSDSTTQAGLAPNEEGSQ